MDILGDILKSAWSDCIPWRIYAYALVCGVAYQYNMEISMVRPELAQLILFVLTCSWIFYMTVQMIRYAIISTVGGGRKNIIRR